MKVRAAYLGMTSLPEADERRLLAVSTEELLRVWNAAGKGPRLLSVGDHYDIVQLVARAQLHTRVNHLVESPEVKAHEVPGAKMKDLVAEYNTLTGKEVKSFRDRPTAEARVLEAMGPVRGRPIQDFVVRYKGEGDSKVREASTRGKVLAAIRERKKVRKSELDAALGFKTSGFITKLAARGHVEVGDA